MRKLSKEKKVYTGILVLSLIIFLFTRVLYSGTLLVVVILYGLLSKIGVWLAGRKVEVKISAEGEGLKNSPVHCKLALTNGKLLPIFNLRMILVMRNRLTDVTYEQEIATSLLPRGNKTLEFAFQDNCCGEIDVEVKKIVIADPLNIWAKQVNDEDVFDSCMIAPIISDAALSKDEIEHFDMESFRFSDVLKGNDPSETVGIKTYESGDSIKAIHWKLSSKLGDVVVREFGYPIDNKVLVLLDKKLRKSEEEKAVCLEVTESIDKTVNLFMSISFALRKNEVNHTLGWFDYEQDIFVNHLVTNDGDLYGAIPKLIASPFREDDQDTSVRFLESDGTKSYGSIFFVTDRNDIEDELERLRDYGEIRVFRPGFETK